MAGAAPDQSQLLTICRDARRLRIRPRDDDIRRHAHAALRFIRHPVGGLAAIDTAMALVEVRRLPSKTDIGANPMSNQRGGRAFDGGAESHTVSVSIGSLGLR